MKPELRKCKLGHAPGTCNQTVFGLNIEQRKDVVLIHGDLKAVK